MLLTLRRPRADYKALIALLIPIVFQNLASASLGLADTLMVGALGQSELGGLNQANTVFFIVQLFAFGIQSGGSVLLGQYWGKKDIEAMNRVMGMSVYITLAFTLITSTIIFLFPRAVMRLTTGDTALIECAARYARVVAYSYVLNGITLVYVGALRSAEDSKMGMIVLLSSSGINIFLNWVLIFGHFGAPALGLEGGAYATFISRIVEVIIVFVHARFFNKKIPIMPDKLLRPGRIICRDYIKYVTPVVLNETLWSTGYSMYAVIFGHMKGAADIVAAYSITSSLERIMLVGCAGIGTAAAVIISKEIGAGKKKSEVVKTGNWLLSLSALMGIFSAVFPLVTDKFILDSFMYKVFTVSAQAQKIGHMMMLMTALRVVFKTYNYMTIIGILRGGGNVRAAMFFDILFMYAWSIPACSVAAFIFGAPISVVFMLATSEDIIKAVVSGIIISRGDWVRKLTRDSF